MKKIVFILLVLISSHLYSQDEIHLVNKTIIEGKVVEIESNKVKYRSNTNPNGPIYSLAKSEISHIVYENGNVEVLNEVYVAKQKEMAKIKKKIEYNRNILSLNPVNLLNGNVNLSFEHISKSGYYSFRIPVKLGFDNENVNYFTSSFSGAKIMYSGEFALMIYPNGINRASYCFGFGAELGVMKYFSEGALLSSYSSGYGQPITRNNYYKSLYIYNGLAITPMPTMRFSVLCGIGPRIHNEPNNFGVAMNISANLGFAF